MNCDTHAEREGTLAVDLPSIGVRRYLCDECRAEMIRIFSSYKGKREFTRDYEYRVWDHYANTYVTERWKE